MKIANAGTISVNDEKSKSFRRISDTRTHNADKATTKETKKSTESKTLQKPDTSSTIKNLGTSIKSANNTIGSLDVMIRSIRALQAQNKNLEKIALKLQTTQDNIQTESLKDMALVIKEDMQKTFENSTFQDENVFNKNYGEELTPQIKINGKKIAPDKLDIEQVNTLKQYAKDLAEQKTYAKEAKKLLKNGLETQFDGVQKTGVQFERLDTNKLKSEEFKAAQGSKRLTLDRVMHLLS